MLEDDAVFEPGRLVVVVGREAQARQGSAKNEAAQRETEIEFFRRQHGRCVVKFRGIDSIAEAEKYIGSEVKVSVDALPAPKEGSFYTFQLKGCEVLTTGGEYIGIVTDVLDSGGTEILKVDCDGEETLIPFAQAFMKSIDTERRKIEVDLPEGLRGLNK